MKYPIIKMTDNLELSGHDFVGVSKNTDELIEITIPYGVDLPDLIDSHDLENMRFLKIYVKSIQKALSSKSVKSSLEEVACGINNPAAAVKIVNDYITYGPFVEFNEIEKTSYNGKINFKRTIDKIRPQYVNDNFIYDTYVIRKKTILSDNYVSLVQGNIINHFMQHGGEILFGTKMKVNVRPISLDLSVTTKLRRELEQTFNSRKQNVIRWMIDYLSGVNIDSENKGKWQYAMIASSLWETMALSVFGNQLKYNKSKYGKRYSFYSITQKDVIRTGSPTQHDVIYEDANNIFIIDAKMYGNENRLLTEEVLGKQFGYYKEAKLKEPTKRIVNILLLPVIPERYDKEGFCDYVIEDPHVEMKDDPDRIIFIYKCSANDMILDYYYSRRRTSKIISEFDSFITNVDVRDYLDSRGTSY